MKKYYRLRLFSKDGQVVTDCVFEKDICSLIKQGLGIIDYKMVPMHLAKSYSGSNEEFEEFFEKNYRDFSLKGSLTFFDRICEEVTVGDLRNLQ